MSKQAIQQAVAAVLTRLRHPISVRALMEEIRTEKPEFRDVPDFDFRSAVLALTANGTIQSTSTNEVEIRTPQALGGHG